jgi:hypothetical protein
MLTPIDVHLLVGLLSKLTTPDNVDIVLGQMVYDEAAQKKRDIDITIRYKDDAGQEVSFVGLQVKDHHRKLGSPDVEQLCMHFKDTPSLKRGGIVSSSGYTKPAIRKAAFHKIDLYELQDWERGQNLRHIQFDPTFKFHEVTNIFTEKPNVKYILTQMLSSEEVAAFDHNAKVLNKDGTDIPDTPTLGNLNNNLINKTLQYEPVLRTLESAEIDGLTPINVDLTIENPVMVQLGNKWVELNRAQITGTMKKVQSVRQTQFKVLVKLDDPEYQSGCAITETSSGVLMGLSTTQQDRALKLVWIPVADRLKQKIYELKIK